MRETKKVPVPATTREQAFVKCDFCGRPANGVQTREIVWNRKQFDVAETAIYWKDGSSYPEGGSGVYHEIHACPDCFRDKVIPTLQNCALPEGTKFQEVEWDW